MNASGANSPVDELRTKLAEVRSEASRLEEEIARLENRGQLELPSAPAVQKAPQSPAEKVALFLDLFGTRRSVFPKRWENAKTGKSGYAPACDNEWRAGIFLNAASHYAENLAHGVETLVVIPFWEEIDRFNDAARAALRRVGILGSEEVTREAVKPLTWTDEQKAHWDQYRVGDRLLFVRDTRFVKRGASAEVIEVRKDGLRIKVASGQVSKITRKQRGAYDVGRVQHLNVAPGDRILMRGRDDASEFANGDLKTVEKVNPETGEITFADGKMLPKDFHAWTYGHALTSYRAQGSTAEESILVLGEVAERALKRRQFYVGNTRYRGKHRIYVSHRENIFHRLADPDAGRELATEFITRNRIGRAERISLRQFRWAGERARALWHAMVDRLRQTQRAAEQRVEI